MNAFFKDVLVFAGSLAIFVGLPLTAYSWKVRQSPVLLALETKAAAYPCIGAELAAERPVFATRQLARYYMSHDSKGAMVSFRQLRQVLAQLALRRTLHESLANRMYAAMPVSRFSSFDDLSKKVFNRSYCALSLADKRIVAAYWRAPSRVRLPS
jgi:hypothetical protein